MAHSEFFGPWSWIKVFSWHARRRRRRLLCVHDRTDRPRERKGLSLLSGRAASYREADRKIRQFCDHHLEIHLRHSRRDVCFLRRRTNAVPALSGDECPQLRDLGDATLGRRLFFQRGDHVDDRRLQADRLWPVYDRDGRRHRLLRHRAVLALREGRGRQIRRRSR